MDQSSEMSSSDEEDENTQVFHSEPFVPDALPKTSKKIRLKEDVENTIFVGNLPNTINDKDLKNLFRKFGPVHSVRFRCAIRKELKIPKKQAVIRKEFHEDSKHINAYVKFIKFESCKAALKMNGEIYKGHHLRVTLADDEKKSDSKKSIFVGNLAFKIQDDDLWSAFEDCGVIESVRVIRDEQTGIGKGFGYVNFKTADSVELALQLNGMTILDRNIRVSRVLSDPKNNRNLKLRKVIKNKYNTESFKKVDKHEDGMKSRNKLLNKSKAKPGFQGQKSKPNIRKKEKKNKKVDKKKMVLKQIADGMK